MRAPALIHTAARPNLVTPRFSPCYLGGFSLFAPVSSPYPPCGNYFFPTREKFFLTMQQKFILPPPLWCFATASLKQRRCFIQTSVLERQNNAVVSRLVRQHNSPPLLFNTRALLCKESAEVWMLNGSHHIGWCTSIRLCPSAEREEHCTKYNDGLFHIFSFMLMNNYRGLSHFLSSVSRLRV